MYCTNCGHKLEDSSQFCSFCGAKVTYSDDSSDSAFLSETKDQTMTALPSKKQEQKTRYRIPCLLFLLIGLALCFFAPFVAITLFSFYEQPTVWQILSNQVPHIGSIFSSTGFWASAFSFITMVVGLITITKPRSILTRILALISEGFMILLFIENLMWLNEGLEGYLGFGFWGFCVVLLLIILDT